MIRFGEQRFSATIAQGQGSAVAVTRAQNTRGLIIRTFVGAHNGSTRTSWMITLNDGLGEVPVAATGPDAWWGDIDREILVPADTEVKVHAIAINTTVYLTYDWLP